MDRMGLPEKVKIGYMTAAIKMNYEALEHGNQGEWHLNTATIKVRPGLRDAEVAFTVLHELFHGIHDLFAAKEEMNEEDLCNIAARGLLLLWRDNPELIKWIDGVIAAEGK